MSKPISILVGGSGPYDPAAGTTDVLIPSLKGVDFYIEAAGAAGVGTMAYNLYSSLSVGGFRFTVPFVDGTQYYVHIVGLTYANDTTGTYTNGFDFNKVVTALFGRIGWMQSPDSPILDATNLISRSGRKFNDGSFHAMVTLNNIKAIMEQVGASDVDFNAYLVSLQRAIILRCINGVFNEPELISQSLLYERWSYGANDQAVTNTGKFTAIQITVPPRVDMAVQIDSVALYFDSAVTFNLYLFNDVKKDPVHTVSVTTVAFDQTIIELTDIVLNHIGGANHGGIFYLGYFQDDIGSAKALQENNVIFKANTPYGAIPIVSTPTGATSFNRSSIGYTLNTNGLNPHFSVFRDHTWQIIKKPSLFDNMIGLQMSAQTIEQGLFANRSNSTERSVKEGMDKVQASMELTGVAPISEGPKTTGLRKQIEQEIKRVKDSFFPKVKTMSVNIC